MTESLSHFYMISSDCLASSAQTSVHKGEKIYVSLLTALSIYLD